MRRRSFPSFVVLGLVVVAVVGVAVAQTAPTPGSALPVSLTSLIDQIVAAFPTVTGDVVEASGGRVTLSAGRNAGAVSGLSLEVYREGREIKHPRTGQVLGRAEEVVGRATVEQVFDGYSVARSEGAGAAVGDRVRTTPGKIRVTVVPLTSDGVKDTLVEAVIGELYEGLNRSGRFTVQLGEQVAPWLRQQNIAPDDFLRGRGPAEVARTFKLDNLVVVHVKLVERKPFMEVRLFTGDRTDSAVSTAMFVPSAIKPAQPGRFSASDRVPPAAERKPRSLLARLLGGDLDPNRYSSGEASIPLVEIGRIDFAVVSMDVAIAPKDRIPRVALTDGDQVFMYRIENRALVPEWTYRTRTFGRVYSIQLADLLGDGTLQVVANRYDTRAGLRSAIIALRDGKPTPLVNEADSLLLAVDETGTGVKQTLWSQPYAPETFFVRGRVDKVVLRDGALVRERSVVVPDNLRLTGLALASLMAKDQRLLAYIDDHNRLRVTADGQEVWSSSSQVGGGVPKIEVERYIERGGRSFFYQLEPIPLALDLDGDGLQELIVPQNQVEGMIAVIYRGPVGLRFQQLNSGFEGLISSLGGFVNPDGGAPTLVAAVVRHKNILKTSGTTQIIMTVPE